MSKKKRKNKRKRTLKHPEVTSGARGKQEEEKPLAVVDVRADLRKTAVLTAVCLGILLVLYLTQSRWLP